MKSLRSTQDTLSAFSKVARHTHRCVGRWGTLLISFSSLCFAGKSLANPFGEKLKLGSAEFIRDGSNLFIRQGSDMLVVDWKDFSIGAGELTQFLQPGGDSAALNRVYGGNPSSIYGSLRANGKVYLINPNGVFIGPSGRVDAGSFIASTLDTSDEEFLKRSNLTFKGESDASVVNLGTITALDGDAFLIARTVENHGTINAPKGTVGLAGGTEVILQPAGDEKIGVSIASGSGKVVNTGKIASAQAELKAAGGNLYALAIKNTGTIRATGVERRGGRVFLRASGGRIENSGTVRSKNVNGTGGRIVFGPAKDRKRFAAAKTGVRVVNTGVVDASGTSGGSVKITADEISLSESSQLLASGTEGLGGSIQIEADDIVVASTANLVGDGFSGGGSIIAVADNAMEFSGTISARATADYADGGFAEISGLNSLKFTGTADLRSTSGRTGSLLLDPVNFTIDATAAGTIVSNLSTSNVIISTAGAGTAAGDIFVNAPVLYNSANTLSLLAHRNIRANASIQNSGAGAINLIAGWDGVTGLGPQGVDFAAFSNAPSTYGNNNGSVFIGSDLTENAVAVGTRFGATNAAGFSMAVTGSDKRNTAFAQFGFTASSGNISGPIHVVLKDDLALTGGKFNFAHAQIGHGGPSSSANIQGAISVRVGGELRILGDVNFSYAQIGHGGEGSRGTQSGSISVHANTLNLTGGSLPHANAQIGHGDGSGDASGLRSGAIEVEVSGETTLMNGPGNNAIWLIGHGTKTPSGVSNADVTFSTSALDHSLSSVATLTTLSQDFADKFTRNLLGGDVTVRASGSGGLVVNGGFAYNSPHNLALIADANATINGSLINGGLGEISLVIDNANAIRPNQNPAASLTIAPAAVIQSQGAIRIFAVTPANTHLGNFNPAQRRYGVWYGDATTVSGVNFKFQPTLTLTANNRTKTYGRTITFTGLEFSATGLQPGDTLAQVLAGVPVISSPGSIPTAGVTASPYPIVFDPALTTNFGYALQLVGGTLSVTPAPLQLTALNQSKIYGSSFVFTGREFSAVGLQNGENVGLVDLASPGAIATAGVLGSPYAITLANARAGTFDPANYEISYVPGTLSVTPAALTITAANRSKVYGGLLSFAGTEFTSAGLLNSDTISSVSLTSAGAINTAGVLDSPYTINVGNAIGTGLANYSITYIPGALTVTAAPLTVTALNRSKVYGDAVIFNGTEFSAAGLQNGEQIALADLASVGAPAIAGVAGSPYSITITNPRGSTFNPTNYAISYIPGALTVTPAPLTIAASNQSKVYGTSLTLNGTEFTSAGLRNSDTITGTIQASPGTSATAGVGGSPYTINIGSAVGTGLQNYAITYIPGALSVTPAPLTLTALNQTKVYGNTFTFVGTEFAATGLKNGESVGTVDLASPGSAATAGVTGSPYTIAITNPRGGTFDAANYAISYVPGSLTVTPAPLTITASNQSKIYGTSFTFNGTEFTSAGLRNADGITSASLSSPGAAATATIGGSPYKISIASAIGTGLENYNITYVPGALTVTQAGLIITATNQTKVYGTLFGFNGTEFASTGLRDGDSIAAVALSSLGAAATAGVAGSPYTINIGDAVGIGLQNYTITYVPGALSVTPAPLTLTALNQTKVYGNTFTFVGTEFAATGLKNGESVGTVDLVSPGSAATAGVTGSPYSIAITNPRGGTFDPANYAVSYVPGSLTITPAALTITASNQSKVYGASFNFGGTEFTSVGLVNGDAISNVNLTSSGAVPTAGVAGSPYTINVGNALGTGLQNYTISYVPGALTVTPAPLTLTARDQTKIYGTTFVFAGTEFTAAGLQNGEGISLVELASAGAPGAAGVAGSPYVITISNPHGGSFDPANYAISYTPGALTVTPATLTITAANQSKVYGSLFSFNGTEFTSAGLVNGDTISSANLTSIGAVPTAGVAGGPYPITIGNGLGVGLENYTISYIPGALAVTPAPLTLTAQNQTKVYGATLSFTGAEFSATGLQNGESIGQVDLASIGAAPTAGVAGGPYAIAISNPRDGTFDPANYAISFVDGTLVITPAALTIKPINQRKRVGNDLIFSGTEFIVSGLQNGETVGLVSLSSAGAPGTAVVGEYSILASNAREGTFDPTNYIVSYQEGTLDVVPKPTPPPPPLPPPPPPVVGGPSLEDLLVLLNQLEQSNQSTPQSAVDPAQDGPSIISGFGIQRLNLNSFFGEQLLEPGGALMIDATGIGPPLPIGEAPQDLENQLAENPHEALEEAIAEDDKKAPNVSTTRYYDVPAGQVFKANAPGEAGLQDLSSGPAILLRATDASIERQLLPAATR